MFINGAAMDRWFPFLTTFPNRALTHGVMSFNGQTRRGLVGERDAVYDISAYADFFDASLTELLELAGRSA